jgi:hypothetical protein
MVNFIIEGIERNPFVRKPYTGGERALYGVSLNDIVTNIRPFAVIARRCIFIVHGKHDLSVEFLPLRPHGEKMRRLAPG